MASRPCPACLSDQSQPLHRQGFVLPEGIGLPTSYTVRICQACGCGFADVEASQAVYDRYYTLMSPYATAQTTTGAGLSAGDRQRLDECALILVSLQADRAARIIDLGCGLGGLLQALQRLGFIDLCGIDPSPACVAGVQAGGVEALAGSLKALPPCAPGDVLVMTGVLEHLVTVDEGLEAALGLLKTDGLLFIEVPDAERYAERLWCPFQDFSTEHINHFSGQVLATLLKRHGLAIVAEGRRLVGTTGDPALWVAARRGPTLPAAADDHRLPTALAHYVVASQEKMAGISRFLASALPTQPSWSIWGAGQFCYRLLADTPLCAVLLNHVIDGNRALHGRRLAGATIRPADGEAITGPVLITSLQHQTEISAAISRRWGPAAWAVPLPTTVPEANP